MSGEMPDGDSLKVLNRNYSLPSKCLFATPQEHGV